MNHIRGSVSGQQESDMLDYFNNYVANLAEHSHPINASSLIRDEEALRNMFEEEIEDEAVDDTAFGNSIFQFMNLNPTQSAEDIISTTITHGTIAPNFNGIFYTRTFNTEIPANLQNILSEALSSLLGNFRTNDPSDVVLPMTEEALNKLDEKKFSEFVDPNKSNECAICKDAFEPDTIIKILPCKHFFHKVCIEEWLRNYHHKCPLCRQSCGEYEAKI